jgi:hypothetical protein
MMDSDDPMWVKVGAQEPEALLLGCAALLCGVIFEDIHRDPKLHDKLKWFIDSQRELSADTREAALSILKAAEMIHKSVLREGRTPLRIVARGEAEGAGGEATRDAECDMGSKAPEHESADNRQDD